MTKLVLLPGALCNYRLFSKQLEQFADSLVIDYSGEDSIELMAQSVLQQAPSRFALAGLSMGGIVAQEIMRVAPERVDRLALLNTNYKAELREKIAKRNAEILAIKTGQLNLNMMVQLRYYPHYFTAANIKQKFELATVATMAYESGNSVFYNQWQALNKRRDYTDIFKQINCPTLVLTGEQDTVCNVDKHRKMYQLLGDNSSKVWLKVIPNCAHLSTLESPIMVNNALHQWLTYD